MKGLVVLVVVMSRWLFWGGKNILHALLVSAAGAAIVNELYRLTLSFQNDFNLERQLILKQNQIALSLLK